MDKNKFILSIDQGTSSTKVLIFDCNGRAIAKGVEDLATNYTEKGFVEQDPEGIYQNVLAALKKCLDNFVCKGHSLEHIRVAGISNQRETFVLWDENGKPLCPAIVWSCKRSVAICSLLKNNGLEPLVKEATGLIIDPYFSATKLIWLFENNEVVKQKIEQGKAYFGTVDTWLLYKLTAGACYLTDHTNASRTLLFNIHTLDWDATLIEQFGLKGIHLPEVKASSSFYGTTNFNGLLDRSIPIGAMLGDSHAASFGEGCFDPGTAKATLGTGCSILMNIGSKPISSANGMVTAINWSTEQQVCYALEGVIVTCGATIEWLKNELHLFNESAESEVLASSVPDNGGVYIVPAFSGLGSPHWQMDRKASISGLSFGSQIGHIVRAGLESIPFQIKDVITAMERDTSIELNTLMTNGGLTSNNFVMQMLADLLGIAVYKSEMPDVSALGAAFMAGIQAGIFGEGIDSLRELKKEKEGFIPGPNSENQDMFYKGWLEAIG